MRRIDKGSEPPCLAEVRREARRIELETGRAPQGDDWDLKECAKPVRDALCREQLGLCVYCMVRIESRGYREGSGGMKIEHFVARSQDPRLMYEWHNLFGVCGGRYMWNGVVVETCDTARKHRPLYVHPAGRMPDPEEVFTADNSGRLNGNTPEAESDLQTLNLNAGHLVWNRKGVIEQLREKLSQDDSPATLRRLYRAATTPGPDGLPPYAPIAARYLERKLRQRKLAP